MVFDGFVEVIDLQDNFGWKKVEEKFQFRNERRETDYFKKGEFEFSASILDLITYGLTEPYELKRELELVRNTFSFLNKNLTNKEKYIIRPNYIGLLKHQDDSWFDFYIELLAICYFKAAGLSLVQRNYTDSIDKKDIDFVFNSKDRGDLRIEVVNIKPSFNLITKGKDYCKEYLSDKVHKKILEKSIVKRESNLVAVIWCSAIEIGFIKKEVSPILEDYSDYFKLFSYDKERLNFGPI